MDLLVVQEEEQKQHEDHQQEEYLHGEWERQQREPEQQ
jgi:hypothetical protein